MSDTDPVGNASGNLPPEHTEGPRAVPQVGTDEPDTVLGTDLAEPEPDPETEAVTTGGDLKGQALDDALEEAGLSKSGTADEKRARLAEHNAAQ